MYSNSLDQYYSSHEVSNLASYTDSSGNTTWSVVSLMYFVSVTDPSIPNSLINGCFVVGTASTPGGLAWTGPASSQPS